MNDPIVSPWLVYWMGRLDVVVSFAILAAVFSAVGSFFVFLHGRIEVCEEDRKAWFARYRWVFAVCVSATLICSFTPTKSDFIGMYAASKTTTANIEKAVEAGKAIKDELLGDVLAVIEAATKEK